MADRSKRPELRSIMRAGRPVPAYATIVPVVWRQDRFPELSCFVSPLAKLGHRMEKCQFGCSLRSGCASMAGLS